MSNATFRVFVMTNDGGRQTLSIEAPTPVAAGDLARKQAAVAFVLKVKAVRS